MNTKTLILNNTRVLVFEAPAETTHGNVTFYDGANYVVYKKGKMLDLFCFDKTKDDIHLIEDYHGKLHNLGDLKTAEIGVADDLFTVVKNGNFYDYEHNGIFYPSALTALKDVIDTETGFSSPYVLIIK